MRNFPIIIFVQSAAPTICLCRLIFHTPNLKGIPRLPQQNILILPRFYGQNTSLQQNIPEIPPKHGGNLLPQQNILILPRFHGQNASPQQNIPKIPPKRGGNSLPQQNILISAPKPGQTATAERKCPGNTPKTRTKFPTAAKHPGNSTKTRRNFSTGKKMSRQTPQNPEEMRHLTKKGDLDVTFTAFN